MDSVQPAPAAAETCKPPLLERLAHVVDRYATPVHGAAALLLFGLFVAGASLLTLEADEAWILLSAANAFGVPLPPTGALDNPTVATGGAYLLAHGLLARVTPALWAHRAVSLVATAALLLFAFRLLRSLGHRPGQAAAGAALVAATPGFLLQASLATGEVIAVLLMVAGAAQWVRRGQRSDPAAAVTGLLLGLACATRINCLAALPALVCYAVAAARPSAARIRRALVAAALGGLIAWALLKGYTHLAQNAGAPDQAAYLSASTGVGSNRKSLLQLVQYLSIAQAQLPLPVLLAVAGCWWARRAADGHEPGPGVETDMAGTLLFMGLAVLAAWVAVAPLPHVRYLWPAIACCWWAGVILLLQAWRTARRPAARLAMHVGVVATCAYAFLAGGLAVANGDSLLLVYQAVGLSPRSSPDAARRFRTAADQRALAGFVAARPEARFFTRQAPEGFPLTYLSGRAISPIAELDGVGERYVILQSSDYAIWRPEPAFVGWLGLYGREAFRSGEFSAWEIAPDVPPPPPRTVFVGRNDIY